MKVITHPIHIVGISIITSNAEAQSTIGKHWNNFFKMPIKEMIGTTTSSSIFEVYSDYENGDKGKYKVTIGYAVDDISTVPNELTSVTIPAGNYKAYQSKSAAPEDIVATWQTIWAADPKTLPRNFVADFEEFKGDEVIVNIGYTA